MRTRAILFLILLSTPGLAQVATAPTPTGLMQGPGAAAAQPGSSDISPLLAQLGQLARGIKEDVAQLRIDKWKADSASKRQAEENADSITRNLSSAFPAIVDQVRANPQSVATQFKLYRNLNALYDVFAGLTESAGTHGTRSEYQALAGDAANLDHLRRAVGDQVENLAAFADSEVVRLRTQASAVPVVPPKKVIVDEQEKPKKPSPKKAVKKPAETPPADSTAAPAPK